MLIVRTPYRIPLAGGGTDLDFYYKKKGGLLISATINEFVFSSLLKRPVDNKILVQTTHTQFADNLKGGPQNQSEIEAFEKFGKTVAPVSTFLGTTTEITVKTWN